MAATKRATRKKATTKKRKAVTRKRSTGTKELEKRRQPPDQPTELRVFVPQTAGVHVNHDSALTYSAFWAAVRVIAETVAQLPWHVLRRGPDGNEALPSHPLWYLLNVQTNPETDAFTWRTVMLGWATTWGNAYAEIQRDRSGKVIALWQIPPSRCEPVRDENGRLWYHVRNGSKADVFLEPFRVLHVKGLGWDGQMGYSVVGYHARQIGAGLSLDQFSTNLIDGAAVPAGIIKNERKMGPDAKKKWVESFKRTQQGSATKRRLLVLDEGMDFKTIGLPPGDAQVIEQKGWGVLDISRIFGVAPHLLGDLQFATFSNIEEQGRDSTIRWGIPWAKRMAMPVNTTILSGATSTQHIFNALLRADTLARFNAYAIAIRSGWMSPNDARRLEDMTPIPGGDLYVMQGQMMTLEQVANPPEPAPAPPAQTTPDAEPEADENADESQNPNENQRQAFVDLLGDVFRRACRRGHNQIKQRRPQGKVVADQRRYLATELLSVSQSVYGAMATEVDPSAYSTLAGLAAQEFADASAMEMRRDPDNSVAVTELWEAARAQPAAERLFDELRTVAYARA